MGPQLYLGWHRGGSHIFCYFLTSDVFCEHLMSLKTKNVFADVGCQKKKQDVENRHRMFYLYKNQKKVSLMQVLDPRSRLFGKMPEIVARFYIII